MYKETQVKTDWGIVLAHFLQQHKAQWFLHDIISHTHAHTRVISDFMRVVTSCPCRHVCHLLKSIEECSGHHDGRPESKTNGRHVKTIKYSQQDTVLFFLFFSLCHLCSVKKPPADQAKALQQVLFSFLSLLN